MELDETIRQRLITFQRIELTEHHIYQRLARVIRPAENQRIEVEFRGWGYTASTRPAGALT